MRRAALRSAVAAASALIAGASVCSAGPEAQPPLAALRAAIGDLIETFGPRYPKGPEYLARLDELAKADPLDARKLADLRREALLANPLLAFDRLLVVKRRDRSPSLGLPANYHGNTDLPGRGFDDEIAVLSVRDGRLTTLLRPGGRFVGDLELHWDADRLLFSMPADTGRWQVFELTFDPQGTPARPAPSPTQVTPDDQRDVDNYDACYLPDERIIFTSTACMIGVPCVGGGSRVANLHLLDRQTGRARRLTFDQDHDWCPTVLPDGRVLFLRWEYGDIPHAFSRILFHMNPDGTAQSEYYGSNSYWPNSVFYARPVPASGSKFVGIVTGHHGVRRMGELVLFDRSASGFEADGAVQRIGRRGRKVEPILLDRLADASWPKFLHPWPLSEKHFLVAAQCRAREPWGIYLVDVFDNMVPLAEERGFALLEPTPLAKRPRPPVLADRVDLSRKDAVVYMTDVYRGGGLKGVPRGTIKRLRLVGYHYAYWGMGGQPNRVGLDGPWDPRRIIGTVPVEPDGSAVFRVPANTPIAVQPLDARGQAVQLMRSWFVAMPGENLSCVGCHERQHDAAAGSPPPAAFARKPAQIEPWYGPARGFSFVREVQPVLDRHCAGCHDGKEPGRPDFRPGRTELRMKYGFHCPPSYYDLRRHVRGPTMEGDLHMLPPWDFHAESTLLVRMLRKGHPDGAADGVRLDAEGWDRLVTWIDLNTPTHGTWTEIVGAGKVAAHAKRRRELKMLYANVDEDPEAIIPTGGAYAKDAKAPPPESAGMQSPKIQLPGPPAPVAANTPTDVLPRQDVDLGDGVSFTLVKLPAGEFVMGSNDAHADERPAHPQKIDKPFWIAATEVTNAQFRRFDPTHDSRLEHEHFLHFSTRQRGPTLNGPNQPAVRLSWLEATAFCKWLSDKTGRRFSLPTEAQWEYACRAGTTMAMNYGGIDTDHAAHANLADATINQILSLGWGLPAGAIPPWHPTDGRFNDKARVAAAGGRYKPNAWGLYDMHGNVAEWTRSPYRPYPFAHPRDGSSSETRMVIRGGSWYDRPKEATSSFRRTHLPYQQAFDLGFRVACAPAAR